MTRDRLHLYWRAMIVTVALAGAALLLRLLVPDLAEWAWLALYSAALLVGIVAMLRYRPRPTSPAWQSPARLKQRAAAIAHRAPLPTLLQRDAALDQARRQLHQNLLQVYIWAIQAMVWSNFSWSPRWLQALCLAGLAAEAVVLWRLRRRIARVDDYDDTVGLADNTG